MQEAAHALAYIVVIDRRFTDVYHWGQRTTRSAWPPKIQRRLLPTAPSREAAPSTKGTGPRHPPPGGEAMGVLLSRQHLTEEQAVDILRRCS